MINLSDIRQSGELARSKPPIVLGNCDYIAKEFRKHIISNNITKSDIVLPVVHVSDHNGRKYTDGHTIVKIDSSLIKDFNKSDFVYIDLSLDQFCEQNFQNNDLINISFGSKNTIENIKILDSVEANRIYNFTGKKF